MSKKILIVFLLLIPFNCFAENFLEKLKDPEPTEIYDVVEEIIPTVDPIEEWEAKSDEEKEHDSEEIREQWKEALGYDIWSPYFIVKGLEKKLQQYFSIEFYNFKSKIEINKGNIEVVFRNRF